MQKTKPAPAKQSYATPALEKGLDIIELLAKEPGGLTKMQIARQLGRTMPEVFRMLHCLEHRGYIAQLDGDEYVLTLKLFRLVQEHPPTERLMTEALPVMHHFAHASSQSCHLGVIEGASVVILAQVNAPTPTGFYVKPGSSIDIMDASTGYVILAHLSQPMREATLKEYTRSSGHRIPVDLDEHLTRIRRKGYEARDSYQVRGVLNISFPVFDERGSAVGALTVPYISHVDTRMPQKDVIHALRSAAQTITSAIGGRHT